MTPEEFLREFGTFADTASGHERLRDLVRSLAITGRLAAPDPADGIALDYLTQVSASGPRATRAKPVTGEPFSIPAHWAWTGLADVVQAINGDRSKNYPSKAHQVSRGIPFINAGHLCNGRISFQAMNFITKDRFELLRSGKVEPKDVLYCLRGSLGKSAIVHDFGSGAIASSLLILRPRGAVNPSYLYTFLVSPFGKVLIRRYDNGTAQPNLSATDVARYPLPLPPLPEQKRIVEKVDQLMALCDDLEAAQKKRRETSFATNKAVLSAVTAASGTKALKESWKRVQDNFEVLYDAPENVQELRQTILQLAVMGKLVRQDARDEPAEKLLPPSLGGQTFTPTPPPGWVHRPLQDLCESVTDGDHQPPPKAAAGVAFLTIGNVSGGVLDFRDTRFVPREYFDSLHPARRPRLGDILYTVVGATFGRPILVRTDREFCVQRHIAILRPRQRLDARYLEYALRSPFLYSQAHAATTGTAQPTVPLKPLRGFTVPVPPFPEQKRIVEKVNHLMAICDDLDARLQKSHADGEILMKAVVEQLVRTPQVAVEPMALVG